MELSPWQCIELEYEFQPHRYRLGLDEWSLLNWYEHKSVIC